MHSFYINLDEKVRRRESIEANFRLMAPPNWQLTRVGAITAGQIANSGIQGRIRDAEKACYVSHLGIIGAAANSRRSVWIREDDTELGYRSCHEISRFLREHEGRWDVLFTDLIIADPGTMFSLFRLKREMAGKGPIALPISTIRNFAGAMSYLVNETFCPILKNKLSTEDYSTPFDIALRNAILEQEVRAYVLFPFVTTASASSRDTSIQTNESKTLNNAWDIFRRFIWLEKNIDICERDLIELFDDLSDRDSKLFGRLVAVMASPSQGHEV